LDWEGHGRFAGLFDQTNLMNHKKISRNSH